MTREQKIIVGIVIATMIFVFSLTLATLHRERHSTMSRQGCEEHGGHLYVAQSVPTIMRVCLDAYGHEINESTLRFGCNHNAINAKGEDTGECG